MFRCLVLILIALLALTACGGNGGKTALTVDEYAAWCGEFQSRDNQGSTWGSLVRDLDEGIKDYNSVAPPPVLEDLHEANLSGLRTMLDYGKRQDAGKELTMEDAFAPELLAVGFAISAVEEELPADLRDKLLATGCIESSS